MDKKITALESQKRNPDRLNVFINDEFVFGISKFIGAWLSVGQIIPEEKINLLISNDKREQALQSAFRFIGFKPRTTFEVRKKLEKLEIPNEAIESIVSELEDKEYLDDRKFAEQWVESRSEAKPRSRFLFSLELKKKGIEDDVINSVLENIPEEVTLAEKFAEKYVRRLSNLDSETLKKKLSGALQRKGFSFTVINNVIEEILKINNLEK